MKKYSLFLMATLMLMLSSCGEKKECRVEGSVASDGYNGKIAYLQGIDVLEKGTLKILDSVTIENKQFAFTVNLESMEYPSMGIVSIGNIAEKSTNDEKQVTVGSFAIDNGTAKIELGETDLVISGTDLNNQFNEMHSIANQITAVYRKIGLGPEALSNLTETEIEEIETQLEDLGEKRSEIAFSLLKETMQTPLGEFLFMSSLRTLDLDQVKELVPLMKDSFKQMSTTKQVLDIIETQAKKEAETLNQPYTDVELESLAGKMGTLSNYVGKGDTKYVLLDFWASWCGPCINEIPYLVNTYAKYKEKGFEIVGISLDQDRNDWKTAIKEHKMTWNHFIDTDAKAATIYGAETIPFTLLLDKDGKIIAMGLRGNALAEKLAELLD